MAIILRHDSKDCEHRSIHNRYNDGNDNFEDNDDEENKDDDEEHLVTIDLVLLFTELVNFLKKQHITILNLLELKNQHRSKLGSSKLNKSMKDNIKILLPRNENTLSFAFPRNNFKFPQTRVLSVWRPARKCKTQFEAVPPLDFPNLL